MRNVKSILTLSTVSLGLLAGCADNDMLQGTKKRDVPVAELPQDVRDLFARRGATINQVEEHSHNDHDKYYVVHFTSQDGRQQKLRYEVKD
jgi:hypothetical protein